MNSQPIVCLTLALVSWFAIGVHADESVEGDLVLARGERLQGRILQLNDGKLIAELVDGEMRSLAAGTWMRWRQLAPLKSRPRVHFQGGSILVGKQDWTGKSPVAIDARQVIVDNEALGKVLAPRERVRCLLLKAAAEPLFEQQSYLRQAAEASTTDRVWLLDGDLLSGAVRSFDGTTLQFELGGQTIPVLGSSIAAVAFATPRPNEEPPATQHLVGLADGSLIEAIDVSIGGDQLSLATSFAKCESEKPENVVFMQSLADSFVYLSDLEPVDYRHTPYFSGDWPLASDRSLADGPLRVGGKRYAKGVAMHSASSAVYRVPKGATQFVAQAAIDQAAGKQGSVVFRVALVTADGLQTAYASSVVRSGDTPQNISVPLADSSAIVLMVDYADYGDQGDHANWLDARMVISPPAP